MSGIVLFLIVAVLASPVLLAGWAFLWWILDEERTAAHRHRLL